MKKISLLTIISICLLSLFSNAQMLHGVVRNESGGAAANVTVEFFNKENKIITSADGSFKLMATSLPDTLIFSSEGTEPYKVIVTEKNIKDANFEVVLLNKRRSKYDADARMMSTASLSEIVITGSGLSRREMGKSSPEMLSGKVSGVKVSGTGGFTLSGRSSIKRSVSLESRTLINKDSLTSHSSLTAGEINDFNKWNMWEDLSESEFKHLSRRWQLFLKERYTVQLVNKKLKPIIGEKVFMIEEHTSDTIWSSVTDNTGKAELWAGFQSDKSKQKTYKIITNSGIEKNPTEFKNGVNQIVIDKQCHANNIVEIAFVVDATGSMDDEIEFLKLELENVLQRSETKYADLAMRYASVFYRDTDDEYITKHQDFQSDMLKVLNFIKLQRSGGGGDFPEAVDSAMDIALEKLSWSRESRAKILFLILDAPPHEEKKAKINSLILKAAAMGVRIIPIACSGTDKSTEFLLRSMALATNGTYTFLTNHSGIGNNHIEPSTDSFKVELLTTLLQRLLDQYLYAPSCSSTDVSTTPLPLLESVVKINVFPNPTTGKFTIQSTAALKDIFLTDFTGKILMKIASVKKNMFTVNISNYPAGVYLIKYTTEENKSGSEKIVLVL